MKIGQYCQRQRCKHVELEQFLAGFRVARVCQRQLGFLVVIHCLVYAHCLYISVSIAACIFSSSAFNAERTHMRTVVNYIVAMKELLMMLMCIQRSSLRSLLSRRRRTSQSWRSRRRSPRHRRSTWRRPLASHRYLQCLATALMSPWPA